ncbi:MAG TPA: hypothetical protein VKT73_15450 [Xanthobacteraceae bacterium]|nr:hypothetical protein [Xanthobacteraceae bacterium]
MLFRPNVYIRNPNGQVVNAANYGANHNQLSPAPVYNTGGVGLGAGVPGAGRFIASPELVIELVVRDPDDGRETVLSAAALPVKDLMRSAMGV